MDNSDTPTTPRRRRRHMRRAACAIATVVVVAGVGIAYASVPGSDGVIHGCYATKGGTLRLVDSATPTCGKGELAIQWNQTGPQGQPGTDGTDGTNGIDGTNGAPGQTGPQGPAGTGVISSNGWFTMRPGYPGEPATTPLIILSRDGLDVRLHCGHGDFGAQLTVANSLDSSWTAFNDDGDGFVLGPHEEELLFVELGSYEVVLRGPADEGFVLRAAREPRFDETGFLLSCSGYATSND